MKKCYFVYVLLISNFLFAQKPGDLDNSFNSKGYFITDYMRSLSYFPSAASYKDGSTVLCGEFQNGTSKRDISIIKLKKDGTQDLLFANSGSFIFDINNRDQITSKSIIQNDDKILVFGWHNRGSDDDYLCLRLNKNGSLDSTFGTKGVTSFTNQSGSDDYLNDAILLKDGKILATGETGISNFDFSLFRLISDGKLDLTFGNNGIVTTAISDADDIPNSLVELSDGSIMVVGYTKKSGPLDFCIVKYSKNGIIDSTFGVDGILIKPLGDGVDNGKVICKSNDNNIYVGGFYYTGNKKSGFILKFDPQGKQVLNFGINGLLTVDHGFTNVTIKGLATDLNNNIVVCFEDYLSSTFKNTLLVSRYKSNGSLDTSFGKNGLAFGETSSLDLETYRLEIQNDQKILISGIAAVNGFGELFIAKMHSGIITNNSNLKKSQSITISSYDNNIIIDNFNFYTEDTHIKLYNINGQSINLNSRKIGQNKVELSSTSILPEGIYFITIIDRKGNLFYSTKFFYNKN